MDNIEQKTDKKIDNINSLLRSVNSLDKLDQSPWLNSALVKRKREQNLKLGPPQALKQVLGDILELLKQEQPYEADILYKRYWLGFTPKMTADDLIIGDDVFYKHQRKAVTSFEIILKAQESGCQQSLININNSFQDTPPVVEVPSLPEMDPIAPPPDLPLAVEIAAPPVSKAKPPKNIFTRWIIRLIIIILIFSCIFIWLTFPLRKISSPTDVPPFLPVGTMLPPAIPQLEVVGTLYITSVNATLNESVIGTFTLRNNSNTPIEVAQLRLAGRGPNTNSWSGPEASFPAMTDVTLLPHTEMVYQQSRTFTQTGLYFAEPVMMDLDGNWQTLQPFQRASFEIVDFKYPFWKIDIFNNVNLNGEPFTSSLPVKAIPNDKGGYTLKFEIKDALPTRPLNTSARIYGRFQFDAAEYHFHCEHHDGCRVFVDGQEWIGVWWDGGGGNDLTRPLTAGFHEVMIEFYDKSGWGFLEVWWEKK